MQTRSTSCVAGMPGFSQGIGAWPNNPNAPCFEDLAVEFCLPDKL